MDFYNFDLTLGENLLNAAMYLCIVCAFFLFAVSIVYLIERAKEKKEVNNQKKRD